MSSSRALLSFTTLALMLDTVAADDGFGERWGGVIGVLAFVFVCIGCVVYRNRAENREQAERENARQARVGVNGDPVLSASPYTLLAAQPSPQPPSVAVRVELPTIDPARQFPR